MSGYVEIRLREFIRQVEDDLPWECPKCDGDLGKVRYATDCHRMTVHLTGAVNERAVHRALCPTCDHELAAQDAGETRTRR